jgi:serine/threonine protein kinase
MLVEGELKPHTKAIDWYLLGIFLYELLHELPPFYSESHEYMEECIRTEKLPVFDASLSR